MLTSMVNDSAAIVESNDNFLVMGISKMSHVSHTEQVILKQRTFAFRGAFGLVINSSIEEFHSSYCQISVSQAQFVL